MRLKSIERLCEYAPNNAQYYRTACAQIHFAIPIIEHVFSTRLVPEKMYICIRHPRISDKFICVRYSVELNDFYVPRAKWRINHIFHFIVLFKFRWILRLMNPGWRRWYHIRFYVVVMTLRFWCFFHTNFIHTIL